MNMNLRRIKNQIVNDLATYIPELQESQFSFSITQLKSRKNLVYEINFEKKPKNAPKNLIIKLFRTGYSKNEHDILKKLHTQNLLVPKILYHEDPYLLLEKVEGVNLCDFINGILVEANQLNDLNQEVKDNVIRAVKNLAGWMATFHAINLIEKRNISEILVLNKGDTRLRDFIFNEKRNTIYGVDFEEAHVGNHIEDLAWICCSLLDTSPGIFEIPEPYHKIELINLFLREYYNRNEDFHFSFNYFAEKLIEYLNLVIERRPNLEIGPLRKQNILRKISKGI
ncbi:MAG: hypothetical protein ACTSU4_02775 [Promethearchaeota archaeon]